MQIAKDSAAGRRQFEAQMEQRRLEVKGEKWKGLRRGWCYGEKQFRKELLEKAQKQVGEGHYGKERQETGEQKARRILGEELKER
jgi:hypothetical protein